ncbi:MAG: rod-binding protein, partial [Phycisphaerales bacterium]|nr:rod-binding protein [Phycisphaerales bacterium]
SDCERQAYEPATLAPHLSACACRAPAAPLARPTPAGRPEAAERTHETLAGRFVKVLEGKLYVPPERGGRAAGNGPKTPRQAAEDFVASTLVQPLLQRLRESSRAAPPFGPGPYERQFAGMADAEIARRMVRSRSWGIVDAIEDRLTSRRVKA